MKINKLRLLTALALGGLVACSTIAQAEDTNQPAKPPGDRQGPPGGPRGNMAERANKMAEDLGLSEDQKAKFQEVMKEQGEKMRALRQDESLSQEDRRAKARELRDATNEKIKTILTAEQFEKWEKNRPAGRRGPGGPGGDRGPRGPRGDDNKSGKPPGDKPADKPEKD